MEKKIKIVQLVSGDLWGGAENVIYLLAKGLNQKMSVDQVVIVLNQGKLEQLCRKEGIQTHVVPEEDNNLLNIAYGIYQVLKNVKPDIIHTHRYKESILALMVKFFCGFPALITTIHGKPEIKTAKSILTFQLDKFVLAFFFKKIISVSDNIAHFYRKYFSIKNEKVVKIVNGIEFIQKNNQEKSIREGIIIGSAGRLSYIKDYFLMIEIARRISKKRADIKFIIAGSGPEKEDLEKRIAEYGLSQQFLLLGHINDMQSFYDRISIYINTSYHEGIPMTVLEAMSQKKIVIAPEVGGLPEIITHKRDGFLIKERKIDLYCHYIMELVSNWSSMTQIGERAEETIIQKFSLKNTVSSYLKLYNTIV